MEHWADFEVVTLDALRAALDELGITADGDLDTLADAFADLPPVEPAADTIAALRGAGLATGILTNASTRTLDHVAARLDMPFDHLLSVDAAQRYKPHPGVYQLAVDATGLPADRIGFVTGNGWDAAGAGAFGFRVAWLRSSDAARLPAVGAPKPRIATWPELSSLFLEGVASR